MSSDMKEAADTCLIVSGGPTDREFAAKFVKERKYPYVIAVDAGLETEVFFDDAPQRMSTSRKRMRRTQTSQSAPLSALVSAQPMCSALRAEDWTTSSPTFT